MTPIIDHTDIVIIGGGIAGVAAAIAAAQAGRKVVLVEKAPYLGGKATAAEVGTICGLYKYDHLPQPGFIVNGFTRFFAQQLQAASQTQPLINEYHLAYLPYQVAHFKILCSQLLHQAGVTVLQWATVVGITEQHQSIQQVQVQTADSLLHYHTKAVADCSGESVAARFLSLPLIESDNYQAAAQVFTLSGINETNETRLSFIILKAIAKAIYNKTIPDYFDRIYLIPGSLHNSIVSFKIGIPIPVTFTAGNLQLLQQTALHFITQMVEFLQTEVTVCQQAKLEHIADEIGIRTGVRTLGKYVLQSEDILAGRLFNDAIANGSWPIEIWQQNKRVSMQYFAKDSYYQVPARCLQSAHIHNLFVGGRCISATDDAIASARVMGICLQTGYAAGMLAAGHAQEIPLEQSVQQIQKQQLKTVFSHDEPVPGI
jgi:hypothetical protein